MSRDHDKIEEKVPCMYRDGGKKRIPEVNCSKRCGTCGWNPAVKEKRLAKRGWRIDEKGEYKKC